MTDSNIIFMYDNLIDSATLTASSEDAGLPVENIQDAFRTEVFKSNNGTFNIVIDHGSAKAVTAIALIDYDWDSEPSTFALEFNPTDSWGSPAATEDLTGLWVANPDTYGNRSCIMKTFASKSYRYNRLNIVHADPAQIGRIFLGTSFIPDDNYLLNQHINIVDPSKIQASADGQESSDIISKYRTVDFGFKFHRTEYAQMREFHKMLNNVGRSKDLFVAFDYSNYPSEKTMYGKFTNYSLPQPVNYDLRFAFKESV